MRYFLFLLLMLPVFCNAQLMSATGSSFTLGNTTYPLNSVALIRSADTDAIGFCYAVIPPTFYATSTILNPRNFANYYTIPSVGDTVYFTHAYLLVNWFIANAVTMTGNLDMTVGEEVISSIPNSVLFATSSSVLGSSSNLTFDGTKLKVNGVSAPDSATVAGKVNYTDTASMLANYMHAGSIAFSSITGTPTTLAGYGITDAAIMGQTTFGSPGIATSFTITISSGHTACIAGSATPSVIVTTGCAISGTTMTVSCAAAAIGGSSITLTYFYK